MGFARYQIVPDTKGIRLRIYNTLDSQDKWKLLGTLFIVPKKY